MCGEWEKKNDGDEIWWNLTDGDDGNFTFTFDKKKVFSLYRDYPWALTPEQKIIFDRENPFWAKYFAARS